MITCCRHCPRRRAGCHGDCPDYRAERARHLEQQEVLRREHHNKAAADDFLIEQARKAKRRRERWI